MGNNVRQGIEIPVAAEGFSAAQSYVEEALKLRFLSPEIAHETMLVFEAVFNTVLEQGVDPGTTMSIVRDNRLGGISLKIGYAGKRFAPVEDDYLMSPELRILEAYADRLTYRYHSGYNTIRISMKKSPRGYFLTCGVGILLAVLAYMLLCLFVSPEDRTALLSEYIFPVEQVFANAMLMVGAPVTLFSLLKNASNTFIVAEWESGARRLQAKALITSAFAIALAIALSLLFVWMFPELYAYDVRHIGITDESFASFIVSMVPASIVAPFEAVSPVPLMVVALLVTYALCSTGEHFDFLKQAIDACFELFSRMLSAVMAALPVFCFLAILDELIDGGFQQLAVVLTFVVFALASTIILLATYALRLRAQGINVREFAKTLIPLLRENLAIGSVIDAVPFNIRYCVRNFGMDRDRLRDSLPVLAQINLDGNCFLITLIAMGYIYLTGTDVTWVNIAVIAMLVLVLSCGAPNQPGSILLGALFVIMYLNSNEMLCVAFFLEVFLGSVQNIVNVISSVVTVAEEEAAQTKAAA
ncbi:MAG: cation:dicarboxylase symporter family transporter [Coriobacteriia bacterium]|nr:cation:dicarboxylase symporter family transporter [Coriobacteriia bacterium]